MVSHLLQSPKLGKALRRCVCAPTKRAKQGGRSSLDHRPLGPELTVIILHSLLVRAVVPTRESALSAVLDYSHVKGRPAVTAISNSLGSLSPWRAKS